MFLKYDYRHTVWAYPYCLLPSMMSAFLYCTIIMASSIHVEWREGGVPHGPDSLFFFAQSGVLIRHFVSCTGILEGMSGIHLVEKSNSTEDHAELFSCIWCGSSMSFPVWLFFFLPLDSADSDASVRHFIRYTCTSGIHYKRL